MNQPVGPRHCTITAVELRDYEVIDFVVVIAMLIIIEYHVFNVDDGHILRVALCFLFITVIPLFLSIMTVAVDIGIGIGIEIDLRLSERSKASISHSMWSEGTT